jgi:hypothetical protein
MSAFKAHSPVIFRQYTTTMGLRGEMGKMGDNPSFFNFSTGSPVAKGKKSKSKSGCGEQTRPLTLRASKKKIPQSVVSVRA